MQNRNTERYSKPPQSSAEVNAVIVVIKSMEDLSETKEEREKIKKKNRFRTKKNQSLQTLA